MTVLQMQFKIITTNNLIHKKVKISKHDRWFA